MIELKIKIPTWNDFTKWFWDKFCFPRRKIVAEYFEWYNMEVKSDIIKYLYDKWDCENNENAQVQLEDLELHLIDIMKQHGERIMNFLYEVKQ